MTQKINRFGYIPSKDDSFSVKSVLQTNAPNASNSEFAVHFKKLWKSKVPKKWKFFIWTAAYNDMFTMEKIQRRLENLCLNPNWCVLCKKSNETTDHIFLRCPYTINIWNTTKNQLNWDLNDDNLPALISTICSNNIKTQKWVIIFNLRIAIIWSIWLERNDRLFNNLSHSYTYLSENICNLTAQWSTKTKLFKNYSASIIAQHLSVFC